MPGEDYQSWSTTALANGNSDTSINWLEGQARASVNNSARSVMAAHAKNRNLQNGSIITTGTANAQAFVSGVGYTSAPTGLHALLKIGATLSNTGPTTLNMDSIGDVEIKRQAGTSLTGGELVASNYVEFLYDGTNWILLRSGSTIISQIIVGSVGPGGTPVDPGSSGSIGGGVFTASGTYTPTPGLLYCTIECVGGGGGGGGAFGASGYILGGGGGGGGGLSRAVVKASEIGASQVVTIGAGGAGGIPGNTFGSPGGTSSVGTLCSALGGAGGVNPSGASTFPAGGAGAGVGTGDITGAGNPGDAGTYLVTTQGVGAGGTGGGSLLGGGGVSTSANFSTAFNGFPPASGYGGGGSGACANNIVGGATGGDGSPGTVIITEYVAQ